MSFSQNDLLCVIMYKNFGNNVNVSILTATIKFMKDSKRFNQPVFYPIFISSFTPFLNFLLKKSTVLQQWLLLNISYFKPYCLQKNSKVSFMYLPLFILRSHCNYRKSKIRETCKMFAILYTIWWQS